MGNKYLPTIFTDSIGEIPSASKWNNNYNHVNLVQWNLINNGDVELWALGDSSAPDSWTLNGSGALIAKDTTHKHGSYSALISYVSADSYLSQDVSDYAWLQGKQVKAWVWIKASDPNQARVKITDGVGTTASSFHTGSGNWELLSVIHSVAVAATKVSIELHCESSGSAYFDAAVLVDFDDIMGWIPSANDVAGGSSVTYAQFSSGLLSARPATPTGHAFYYATDIEQLYVYIPAIGWREQ